MNNATKLFDDVIENEISNSNLGYAIIDQLQKTKKGKADLNRQLFHRWIPADIENCLQK